MNQNDTVSAELAQPEKGLPKSNATTNNGTSRRKFLGQVGAALAGGAVLGKAAIASGQDYNPAIRESILSPAKEKDPRVKESLAIRNAAATAESKIPVPPHTTNGDEQLYPDKSGTYSKGILQDGIGLVNLAAFTELQERDQQRYVSRLRECHYRRTANSKRSARRPRVCARRERPRTIWQCNLPGQSDKPDRRPAGARSRQRNLWNGVGRDVLGFAAARCCIH